MQAMDDITLRWPKADDDVSRAEAVKTAVRDQLGLALEPARESMEVLGVDKATD